MPLQRRNGTALGPPNELGYGGVSRYLGDLFYTPLAMSGCVRVLIVFFGYLCFGFSGPVVCVVVVYCWLGLSTDSWIANNTV
jgi:hypothetical protein